MAKKQKKETREELEKVLRATTLTITISICALAMGAVLIYMTWKLEQKFSVVGLLIIIGMIMNMIPVFKRRKDAKERISKLTVKLAKKRK